MKVAHATPAATSPAVLKWAIDRAGTSPAALATSVGTSEAVVAEWLSGRRRPSFRQARSVAEHLHVPFGFIFLEAPPPEALPIPDFRTVNGRPVGKISLELRDVIYATLRRQSWLAEYKREQGAAPLAVVGSAAGITSPVQIASLISSSLKLSGADRPSGADDFLRFLVERTEDLGIGVLRSGIVGTNTHRKLDVKEFRGFSLSDSHAPLVFINGVDAKHAQIFTLIHELGHIWLGQSGISGSVQDDQGPSEALCNRIAAEVLVPGGQFNAYWDDSVPDSDAITSAARHFRVSRYVIAIRAFESGLLTRARLDELLQEYASGHTSRPSSPGGDFYRTTIARNGRVFTEGVVAALSKQHVLIRDASSLLEVRPAHLGRLSQELRSRG